MEIVDLPTYISVRKKQTKSKYCPHNSILVVQEFRTLECADCQSIIDPFDYMVTLARKEDNYVYSRTVLRTECKNLKLDIEEKRKILISLNSKIKRRNAKLFVSEEK